MDSVETKVGVIGSLWTLVDPKVPRSEALRFLSTELKAQPLKRSVDSRWNADKSEGRKSINS